MRENNNKNEQEAKLQKAEVKFNISVTIINVSWKMCCYKNVSYETKDSQNHKANSIKYYSKRDTLKKYLA